MKKELFKGRVVETLPDATFKIELENGEKILAYLAGKMKINFIKVIVGDLVMVEISSYDKSRGRIIKRL